MSSLRILNLPLGDRDGFDVRVIVDWEKSEGYVAALQFSDAKGDGHQENRSVHPTPTKALRAAITIYDRFQAGNSN